MKVIIAGGRHLSLRLHEMDAVVRASGFLVTEVVCGKAKGIDTAGRVWAELLGLPVAPFPADWKTLGKGAGHARNRQMAEYADALIAVWDGESPGTKNMIDEATEHGLQVFVHRV